jgi:hypothetical protein
VATVSRRLKRMKLKNKKTETRPTEADNVLRAAYIARMSRYRAHQLVVVGESAANERTADRRWSWSEKGVVARFVVKRCGGVLLKLVV